MNVKRVEKTMTVEIDRIEGVDMKGRNGYCRMDSIYAFGFSGEDRFRIEFRSKRIGNAPPMVIEGNPSEVRSIFACIAAALPEYDGRDSTAMDEIRVLMSGREWDADTMTYIRDIVERTGRPVDDLDFLVVEDDAHD